MDPIVLHQPPGRPWGSANLSPFCAKLETYLRIAEVPHQLAKFGRNESPTGKVPYVVLDGGMRADSQLILEELERRRAAEGKPALDAGIAPADVATARATRRMLEEAYYFILLYARWMSDDGYAATREAFKAFVPGFVMPFIRRAQLKKLYAQGTGRHDADTVMRLGAADLDAVADTLGDRAFFLGDQVRTIDATVWAFADATLCFPVDTPLRAAARARPNLVAYHRRLRDRWWNDLPTQPT